MSVDGLWGFFCCFFISFFWLQETLEVLLSTALALKLAVSVANDTSKFDKMLDDTRLPTAKAEK